MYGAGIGGTLWRADKKYREGFEMCSWRRTEKIGSIDWVRNEQQRKANCIGQVLRRNGVLKHVIDVEIEGRI